MTQASKTPLQCLTEGLGSRNRRVMRRCFMTGKQCIFSAHLTESANRQFGSIEDKQGGSAATEAKTEPSIFVIMPFSPNLETFYRWSLRPYLLKAYELPENLVKRADDVRDIGYIVCEKICRRIQESDLVIVDVSLVNSNVFYEIGLAFGLSRPLVLMQNESNNEQVLSDNSICQSLGLGTHEVARQKVLSYPGVGILKHDVHKLEQRILRPQDHPRVSPELKIRLLKISRPGHVNPSAPPSNQVRQSDGRKDLFFTFEDILKGAVGVAMAEIRDAAGDRDQQLREQWLEVVQGFTLNEWERFSTLENIEVSEKASFETIAKAIRASFAVAIDVTDNDPLAYFWLGYCHSQGLNVIPVFRKSPQGEAKEKLAFDIHALWYAEYDDTKPYDFKTKMREILEHLLARDLPHRQKRAFWDRFPAEKKLKVLTGAIHVEGMNREMVGDWDLRTVSELFSYLPTVREALAIELVTPIYSPEQAFRRVARPPETDPGELREKFLRDYCRTIETQLGGCNAIIIASPDVNPVTEYVLHKVYQVRGGQPFECNEASFQGCVAVKQAPDKKTVSPGTGIAEGERFARLFYREVAREELPPNPDKLGNLRGFAMHADKTMMMGKDMGDPKLFEVYKSQDEGPGEFHLLGHLVVAPSPADPDGLVVLLNGVSGPATFALAQLLTGGSLGNRPLNALSEELLAEINEKLDASGSSQRRGVECIVKVKVVNGAEGAREPYVDSRQPVQWSFLVGNKQYRPRKLGEEWQYPPDTAAAPSGPARP